MLWNQFKNPEDVKKILSQVFEINKGLKERPVKIMEVCGTHTMAIAKSGIKSILPSNVKLISGPGCPVCVTPAEIIDNVLELSNNSNLIIATYGDMLRVPGTTAGESLEKRKALGANVAVVYSVIDAVDIAIANPQKDVVFLGIGFETTVPGSAIAMEYAVENNVDNFYLMSMHKLVEPVLRELIQMEDFDIDGFLCPGHVAAILGEDGFSFLADEYKIPSVICGFEASDIITSIYKLLLQLKNNKAKLENEYLRVVGKCGNIKAKEAIFNYFEPCDDIWRGIGIVNGSGLRLKSEYARFDAYKRFSIPVIKEMKKTACSCGEVIKGKMDPDCCKLFGNVCVPENPVGPCMVSSEGACAAFYKYLRK